MSKMLSTSSAAYANASRRESGPAAQMHMKARAGARREPAYPHSRRADHTATSRTATAPRQAARASKFHDSNRAAKNDASKPKPYIRRPHCQHLTSRGPPLPSRDRPAAFFISASTPSKPFVQQAPKHQTCSRLISNPRFRHFSSREPHANRRGPAIVGPTQAIPQQPGPLYHSR